VEETIKVHGIILIWLLLGDPKLSVLQIDYAVIKLHENQLWRHLGDVIKTASPKIRHQNDVKTFPFSTLILAKPCRLRRWRYIGKYALVLDT